MTPDQLLADHTPGVRAITEKLRRAVRAAIPDAEERVLPGWHAFGYRHAEAGHVCAIFPMPDEVKLYLEFGANLALPAGALLGETKQTRHLRFVRAADVRPRALAPILVAALVAAAKRREVRRAARPARTTRRKAR